MRHLPLLLAAACLTACQAGPGVRWMAPAFRLDAPGTPAMAALAPAEGGTLTVRFDQVLGQRRLQAVIADVERVVIRLQGADVDVSQTIEKAAIVAGQTSHTFTGLPPGAVTVTVRALDAAGDTLGSEVATATVTAGQTTVAAVTVKLVPTVANPRTLPNTSSGGGGSTPATGALETQVTLTDGTPVVTPPVLAQHFVGVERRDVGQVVLADDGAVWATVGFGLHEDDLSNYRGDLYRVAPGGTPAPVLPSQVFTLFNAAAGRVFAASGWDGAMYTFPAAQAVENWYGASDDVDAGPDGRVWASIFAPMSIGLKGFSTATETFTDAFIATDGSALRIRVDGQGGIWTLEAWGDGYSLRRYDPDARTRTRDIPLTGETEPSLAKDGQGNLWYTLPSRQALVKMSPAGDTLGTYYPAIRFNTVYVDPEDRVWVYEGPDPVYGPQRDPAPGEGVARLSLDGATQAYYHVGAGVAFTGLAASGDDLWVGTVGHGLLELDLTP